GRRVVLAKPRSFMNLSGGPTVAAARFYKVAPADVIVVHDELDLPFATLRMKLGGGDNGHNGLPAITTALGTKDYLPVHFGIDRPSSRQAPADYVLKDFSTVERKELPFAIDRCADAVEALIGKGLEVAQNAYH